MTAAKRSRAKAPPIWCDHCNAAIMPASVKGCLRQTCRTKALLADRERQRRNTTP